MQADIEALCGLRYRQFVLRQLRGSGHSARIRENWHILYSCEILDSLVKAPRISSKVFLLTNPRVAGMIINYEKIQASCSECDS